jgi:hypothetical protein
MFKHLAPIVCAGVLVLFGSASWAASYGPVDVIDPIEKSELWLNPGLYSYHFDQNRNFNSVNYGFGAEYRFSSVASLTVGSYRNSYYHPSAYIGAYWQPIAAGPVNIGVVAGAFNGYANTNNGGWFPAVLPALTIEGDLLGINLIYIPTVPNRVSGSLSLQLKLKVLD